MAIASIELRKDDLIKHFLRIVKDCDYKSVCRINYGLGVLELSRDCAHAKYQIDAGDYFIHKQTSELMLFLGVAVSNNSAKTTPWVLSERQYRVMPICDSHLTERFHDHYIVV